MAINGNAIYSAGFSIYALLLTLSSTGVPNAVAKLVSEHHSKGDDRGANRIFKIALVTFSLIGLIGTFIMFFGAHYISHVMIAIPEAEISLVALSPAIFFVAVSSVFRGYFNGLEKMKATAKSQTVEQLFKTILTIIIVEIMIVVAGANTKIMAAGANLATTLATITSFFYLYLYYRMRRKEIGKQIVCSRNYPTKSILGTVKKILFVSIPMSLSAILSSLNRNIDGATIVRGLKHFLSEEEAKIQYGILSGKVDTLTSLPMSFNIAFATALVPTITQDICSGNIEKARKRISFSLLITQLIGLPCMIGMILYAKPILELLFPNASAGEIIFQVSCLSIICILLEQTVNGALQGIGKIVIPAISLGIGVIVKLILNLVLVPIPEIGVLGAAIATATCHAISFIIGFIILNKKIKLKLTWSQFIIKPMIATLIMAVCSYATFIFLNSIQIGKMATIITIIIAMIVYLLSVVAVRILSKEEIMMLPKGDKLYKILQKTGI